MKTITRTLIAALVAIAMFGGAARQTNAAENPAVTGTAALGQCLDAAHPLMGPGQYVQAPDYFDPVKGTDAELACYGFPLRPASGEALQHWTIAMHAAPLPKTWVRTASTVLNTTSRVESHPANQRRAWSWNGNGQLASWGGWEAYPNSGYTGMWLVFGQWIMPYLIYPSGYNNHVLSQWVGLGCCQGAGNQLVQTGTYIWSSQGYPQYQLGFFYEVPVQGGGVAFTTYGPSVQIGQYASGLAYEETTGTTPPVITYFQACNETTQSCTWSPSVPYGSPNATAPEANFEVEDNGAYGCTATNSCTDAPPYAAVFWGPRSGPLNYDEVWENPGSASYFLQNTPSTVEAMNSSKVWPAHMLPTNVDGNSNFAVCNGTFYSFTPTSC